MAITQRSAVDVTSAVNNWGTGVGRSGPKWIGGIQRPRRLPNADPAKNVTNWQAGVQNAGPKMQAAISDPNYLVKLEAGATAKQGSYTQAGTTGKAAFQSAFPKVQAAINAGLAALAPKGPKGTNGANATAYANAAHATKGK
jgi:hypothetical protein